MAIVTGNMSVGPVESLNLTAVSSRDQILIHTENSDYQFAIVDAKSRRGFLKGGSFGEHAHEAFLVASLPHTDEDGPNADELQVSSRALFLLPSNGGIQQMVTSEIRGLEINHRAA